MDKFNYINTDYYNLKRNIGNFEIFEPFYREIKLNYFGNDVWRLKYLYSTYLYHSGKGINYEINQTMDNAFLNIMNNFKKEFGIKEKNIGIETFNKVIDLSIESFLFFIEILLPDNRNNLGTLNLYDIDGNLLYSCRAKGQGQYIIKTEISQQKVNGDTPIGIYLSSYESGILKNQSEKFGVNGVFRLWYPLYGHALNIYKISRDGILIHGGSDNENLRKSHGCVIINNTDQKNIQKIMINKIKHPYFMPTKYIEIYTGITFIKRI